MKKYFLIKLLPCIAFAVIFLSNKAYGQFNFPDVSDVMPDGWNNIQMGNHNTPSKFAYVEETGSWYFDVYGQNMWGDQEDIRFAYFETEEDKQIVCQIVYANLENDNGKAFIMIRASLDQFCPWGYMENRKKDVCFNKRETWNGGCSTSSNLAHANEKQFPRWMRYIRQGSFLTGFVRDTDDIPWVRQGPPQKLDLQGVCFMGVGVCGHSQRARVIFQNVVVEDIDIPYKVDVPVADQGISLGQSLRLDVSKLFGHYGDDYFQIGYSVSNPDILKVTYSEAPAPAEDLETYFRYITITGLKDGVTAVRLTFDYAGFKLSNDFVVDVTDPDVAPEVAMETQAPNSPWKFEKVGGKTFTPDYSTKDNRYMVIAHQKTEPFKGAPLQIPGGFFGADFDLGGYGLSFRDNDQGVGGFTSYRQGKTYSDYNPNINSNGTYKVLPDYDPAPYVASTNSKDWLRYTIEATTSGYYDIEIDQGRGGNATFQLFLDGAPLTGRVTNPGNSWAFSPATVVPGEFFIEAGVHTFDYYMWEANQDLGQMRFTLSRAQDAPDPGYQHPGIIAYPAYLQEPTPYHGQPFTVPGEWRAWEYDNGGMYVSYFDFSTNNEGGGMGRTGPDEGVDLGGGGNIGWTEVGEWTIYSIDVPETDYYSISLEVACGGGDAKFNFEVDNVDCSGVLFSPNTSDWGAWTWVSSLPVTLEAGVSKLKIIQHKGGFDIRGIRVTRAPGGSLDYEGSVESGAKIQTLVASSDRAGLMSESMYLYQENIDLTKKTEVNVKIESVKNTGAGSFGGIVLRGDNTDESTFVTLGAGAFEGLRINYQWQGDRGEKVTIDRPDINLPVYLKLRTEVQNNKPVMYAYYSYDNEVWDSMLEDPLLLNFMNNNVNAGIALIGGKNTSIKRYSELVTDDLSIKYISGAFDELNDIMPEPGKTKFEFNPTAGWDGSQNAKINFSLVKPGRVVLNVYNYYGVLVTTIVDEYRQQGNYTESLTKAQMGNHPSGTYLIKLVTPELYDYERFIYKK